MDMKEGFNLSKCLGMNLVIFGGLFTPEGGFCKGFISLVRILFVWAVFIGIECQILRCFCVWDSLFGCWDVCFILDVEKLNL